MPVHVHEIGKRRQGPSVENHLRCVSCGSSTKNRKYERCTQSEAEGGRICLKCVKSNPNKALNCSLWVPHSRTAYCRSCTSPREDLLNCYACDEDVCVDCVEPITLAFWFNTGSMYVLCTGCCPSDLYACQDSVIECNQNFEVDQYFCALCQDWHIGQKPTTAKEQCEECDLPWDEAPPICKAAFSLFRGGPRVSQRLHEAPQKPKINPEKQPTETAASSSNTTEPTHQAGPLMILRDTVLSLVGKIDKLDSRLAKIENGRRAHTSRYSLTIIIKRHKPRLTAHFTPQPATKPLTYGKNTNSQKSPKPRF